MSGSLPWWAGAVMICVCLGMIGCNGDDANPAPGPLPKMQAMAMPGSGGFSEYYKPVAVNVTPNAAGYALPLDLGTVANAGVVEGLTGAEKALVAKNGFVVRGTPRGDNVVSLYDDIEESGDPIWVSPDAVLHVFHVQFGETLKLLEEVKLIPLAVSLTERMEKASEEQYGRFDGELKEAARRDLAYFSVARMLLDPKATPPAAVAEVVRKEVALIEGHQGMADSPLFGYKEDYSQYVPRGHYTRSEPLKAYFKAMMWYGRLVFLLKGKDVSPEALVSAEEARRQTLAAALIAANTMWDFRIGPDKPAPVVLDWQRLYRVTAFFAGLADDLTPKQYADGIKEVAGAQFGWAKLAEPETLVALRDKLAALEGPKIYSGTGAVQLNPPFSPEQLNKLLADTQGLRFMGQRYTPDSFMFQQLVFPAVEGFTGTGQPFTMVKTQGGPQRMFARGLDVMAVLGSDRALAQLKADGDTAYGKYDEQMAALRKQFGGQKGEEWGKDLYSGWVYSLAALIEARPEGYPNYMRTAAWENRQLQAALASWAQLRHDTILYAKQVYPPAPGAAPPGPPPPPEVKSVGYVEAVPEFYARLLALTNAMQAGLKGMGLLDKQGDERLGALSELLQQLTDISVAELAGKALSKEQEDTIKYFSSRLNTGLYDMDKEGLKTTVVADVLTDMVSEQALEEGSGYLREIVVAYSDAAGHVFLGRGATLSYYEFKQPMEDRLTDEAWRKRLEGREGPKAPGWVEGMVGGR